MFARRLAIGVAASVALLILFLAFADFDLGTVLCFGVALVSVFALLVVSVVKRGRQRFESLFAMAAYIFLAVLLFWHFGFVRDHVRWMLLSGGYKARVLAQPPSEELKHVEWDGWGFAGADTTVFLVFDPTDSLAGATESIPPIKARGLPCEVDRVRRLSRQWYAVLFYTDAYWGQEDCK